MPKIVQILAHQKSRQITKLNLLPFYSHFFLCTFLDYFSLFFCPLISKLINESYVAQTLQKYQRACIKFVKNNIFSENPT